MVEVEGGSEKKILNLKRKQNYLVTMQAISMSCRGLTAVSDKKGVRIKLFFSFFPYFY